MWALPRDSEGLKKHSIFLREPRWSRITGELIESGVDAADNVVVAEMLMVLFPHAVSPQLWQDQHDSSL